MAVTLSDIAKRTGLGVPTISQILNDTPGRSYREETRVRVIKAAREMGYRANSSARAARTGRFNAIAMLLGRRREQSYLRSGLLDGVYDVLEEHDLHLTIARVPDEDLTDEAFVPKMLREWMTDGMLINYVYEFPPRMVELIERYDIPSIWINAAREYDCVTSDNYHASQDATRRLLELGHRNIAFLDLGHPLGTDLTSGHYAMVRRWLGYAETMQVAGLTPRHMSRRQEEDRGQWAEVLTRQLSASDRPTAVLASMDGDATVALLAAARAGLSVPKDLSMITFAGGLYCNAGVFVDSMSLNRKAMGQTAAAMLLEKIDNRKEKLAPRAIAFDYRAGDSLAAPDNQPDNSNQDNRSHFSKEQRHA